jgi:two-component system LytT family sensor kinase
MKRKLPLPYWLAIAGGFLLAVVLTIKRYLLLNYRLALKGAEPDQLFWDRLQEEFWINVVNYVLWGMLMPLVYYIVVRFKVYAPASAKERLAALAASLGMALLHESVSNVMYYLPMHLLGEKQFTTDILHIIINLYPVAMIDRLIEFWIIYAIFSAIDYQRKFRDQQIELAQVAGQLYGSQLNALRLQLQPHFLFNTLNTISSLMEFDTKGAQKIVSKLGSLLRGVLDKDKRNFIPLREELAFIKSYLDIEQVRFNDRLELRYNIDEQALDALVPSLILQPLVENAIKHGFAHKTGKGLIEVAAIRQGDQVNLQIRDDGEGSNYDTDQLLSPGIGLKNVQDRLNLLYPQMSRMEIITSPGKGFEVNITIPYKRQEG